VRLVGYFQGSYQDTRSTRHKSISIFAVTTCWITHI